VQVGDNAKYGNIILKKGLALEWILIIDYLMHSEEKCENRKTFFYLSWKF
jgi:hypothetical protein